MENTFMDTLWNTLLYAGVGAEDYNKVRNTIAASNRTVLKVFSSIVAVAFLGIYIMSLVNPSLVVNRVLYLVCSIVSIVCILISTIPSTDGPTVTKCAVYLFAAMIVGIGIAFGTLIEPEQASVSFVVLMFAVPLIFTDIPLSINISTLFGILVYSLLAYNTQEREMFAFNMSCVIPYGLINIVLTTLLMKNKVRSFVLQDKTVVFNEIKSLNAQLEDSLSTQKKQVEQYQELNSTLQRQSDVIAQAGMGVWSVTYVDGEEPQMFANGTMKKLLGIEDSDLTPTQIFKAWYQNVDQESLRSFFFSVERLVHKGISESTYKWHHPVLGERVVRSGGFSVPIENGYVTSGYHYDVTEQAGKEMRSRSIIDSLASSYDFLAYVSLDNTKSFTILENSLPYQAETYESLDKANPNLAINYLCNYRVAEEFRPRMREFTDLNTLNDRMKDTQALVTEYRNVDGVWYMFSYISSGRNSDGSLNHVICAIRKIDAEKQAELRNQRIIDENIAANKAKTQFLQNMSHEIRTPLNAMFGFAQLLGLPDGSLTPDEKAQYNSYVHNSYNMLDMLIGDIIDISDAEHNHYRINLSNVNVESVCQDAITSVEYRVPASVKLYYTSDMAPDVEIRSDGRRIQQVLVNYLTNACKHTSKGEIHLHVSDRENPGMITFSVTDTGTGVPKEKANLIFQRFTKLNEFDQGSGLGLNICLMVAEKLQGRVYLDNSYTSGARFVFELPYSVQ